ncbi:MAG: phytanoyl-CoA dioxygenase family protein, partial [Anaerolineales bacterium]|nr:phytanoyl-CoA dioxygenase family protein [Anaerolineales bacterium]
ESGFRLGFIPGSHRPQAQISLGRRLQETRLKWVGAMSYLFVKLQEWASQAEWIATEPGDCLIFDPRILHSGSYITGPKYSMFLGYGIENKHFFNHANYYRRLRSELGYADMAPELAQRLQAAGLYPQHLPTMDKIDDAWVPPQLMKNLVGRGLKKA